MAWYAQLVLYLVGFIISFAALWQIDFNKFMRINKKQFAILVYVVLSLALGYLIGRLFIELGDLIHQAY